MARVTLDALPGVPALLARAAAPSLRRPDADHAVLDRTVLVHGYRSEPERLAAYARVCGFTLRDALPATWLHVLTFPLQAWIMSRSDFPFALPGMVHLSNDMTLHRGVGGREPLTLEAGAMNLRPHTRGATVDLVGRALVDGELVWEGTSVYLAPGTSMPGEPVQGLRLDAPHVEPSQLWQLPADLGRQYARVSGDINPIHLSPLTARAFGQKRTIIHGMWTHARALAALEGRLPDSFRAEVQFTKPLSLPGSARFGASESDGGTGFVVTNPDASKPYLIGRLGRDAGR